MKTAFQPVTVYKTADGTTHLTEKAAQEHAENVAGDALQLLLKDVPQMGHQMLYYITCHMLRNPDKYIAALKHLQAFEPSQDES